MTENTNINQKEIFCVQMNQNVVMMRILMLYSNIQHVKLMQNGKMKANMNADNLIMTSHWNDQLVRVTVGHLVTTETFIRGQLVERL